LSSGAVDISAEGVANAHQKKIIILAVIVKGYILVKLEAEYVPNLIEKEKAKAVKKFKTNRIKIWLYHLLFWVLLTDHIVLEW
jgi:hypothetical protein